jgi:hypothetical protein
MSGSIDSESLRTTPPEHLLLSRHSAIGKRIRKATPPRSTNTRTTVVIYHLLARCARRLRGHHFTRLIGYQDTLRWDKRSINKPLTLIAFVLTVRSRNRRIAAAYTNEGASSELTQSGGWIAGLIRPLLNEPFQTLGKNDQIVQLFWNLGVPGGIRTRVTAVKGRCPRPG